MIRNLFLVGVLFTGSCRTTKKEIQTDWRDYLDSKGIHSSICVQGLVNRLESWDCSKIEVAKYQDNIQIECFRKKETERETYWERHMFVIRNAVLTKKQLNFSLYKHPKAICIDHIRAIDAYELKKPKKETIKMK